MGEDNDIEKKDLELLKRLKRDHPKIYEELMERLKNSLKSKESKNL